MPESTPQLCKVQPPGSALPCSAPQPGRRQGNLPQAHALSAPCLAFKGAFLCQDPMGTSHPQELSRSHSRLLRGRTTPGRGPRLSRSHQAHHLQKHKSTSSSAGPVCSPRRPPLEGGRRLRGPACCALTAHRAPGARAADCSCDLAQAAGRQHCLHLVSSPGRGSPGPLP